MFVPSTTVHLVKPWVVSFQDDSPKPPCLTFKDSMRFEVNLVFSNFNIGYLEITAKDEYSEDYGMRSQIHFLVIICSQLPLLGLKVNGLSRVIIDQANLSDIHMLTRPNSYTFTDEAYITVVLGLRQGIDLE